MLLIRGSVSPLRTRRSSASDDGRVFVGSRPRRLYIVRTASVSAPLKGSPVLPAAVRTAASAAASGAFSRGSRSTTVAPSSHSTPARTTPARSGATESFNGRTRRTTRRDNAGVRFGNRRDDSADALGKLFRVAAGQPGRVDRLVHDKLHAARVGRNPASQHHVAAADNRDRHDW